jgi:hypothetical protein
MKCVIIKIAVDPTKAGNVEYPGWIAADTEDTLAVDLRIPGCLEEMASNVWYVTHLPTGHRVCMPPYTDADSRERAIELAQGFYREMKALGVDLTSSDPKAIVAPVMAKGFDERIAFWTRVAGWPDRTNGLVVNSDTTMHPAPQDQPGD